MRPIKLDEFAKFFQFMDDADVRAKMTSEYLVKMLHHLILISNRNQILQFVHVSE